MAFIVLVLVLYALAVARVTRLIAADVITDPLRIAVMRKWGEHSTPAYFLQCRWCLSMWLGLATAPLVVWQLGLSWWVYPLLSLGVSQAVGLASALDPDDYEVEIEVE